MLIPGALFGYFAGYNFWFPKAFGFKLDEPGGGAPSGRGLSVSISPSCRSICSASSACRGAWSITIFPGWQPWLIIAAVGACFVALGLVCQVMQLIASFKNKRACLPPVADPWDGRTLEWATASPPTPYNFALLPKVDRRSMRSGRNEEGRDADRTVRLSGHSSCRATASPELSSAGLFRLRLRHGLVYLVARRCCAPRRLPAVVVRESSMSGRRSVIPARGRGRD